VIPLEYQVWGPQECADYLKQEKSTFLKRTQYATDFPARLSIPGHPRWSARAVVNWALQEEITPQ
jgi:hypothetical protein